MRLIDLRQMRASADIEVTILQGKRGFVIMALKPNGSVLRIREQIIDDNITGLKLQFKVSQAKDAPFRLVIYGATSGAREILFDADGREAGGGVSLSDLCRPSWISEVAS